MANIQAIRKRKGISQNELARRLSVTQSTISQWETGRTVPRLSIAKKIAAELNCTVDELLEPDEAAADATGTEN